MKMRQRPRVRRNTSAKARWDRRCLVYGKTIPYEFWERQLVELEKMTQKVSL